MRYLHKEYFQPSVNSSDNDQLLYNAIQSGQDRMDESIEGKKVSAILLALIEFLKKQGTGNAFLYQDIQGNTPLHLVAGLGDDWETVLEKLLLANPKPANSPNQEGNYPLNIAIDAGVSKSVQVLVDHTDHREAWRKCLYIPYQAEFLNSS